MIPQLSTYTDCWKNYRSAVSVQDLLAGNGWAYLHSGRQRAVWRRADYVFKIPRNEEGLASNRHERKMWAKHRQHGEIPYAACRLMCQTFLIMEYALFPGPLSYDNGVVKYSELPPWIHLVDCGQAGYNSKGQLVAWDYGMD